MFIYLIFALIISYLLGSFSSAYWFGKWFYKIDIRKHGSENAGATNVLRVLGAKAAIPVFIIDILKSFLAVNLVIIIPNVEIYSELFYLLKISLGVIAVIGHIFPIFSGFAGGKGVASMLGVVIALHPMGALITFAVFLAVFLISRIVSISSMTAAITFPFIIYALEGTNKMSLFIFSILAAILIVITHKKNIKRLLKGEEKRIVFKK